MDDYRERLIEVVADAFRVYDEATAPELRNRWHKAEAVIAALALEALKGATREQCFTFGCLHQESRPGNRYRTDPPEFEDDPTGHRLK